MNCDTCLYRVALPGFAHRVGAPQSPHHHPDDPTHHYEEMTDGPRGMAAVPETLE
jgi:sirohydrochlorin cobaltochelatase